MKKKKVLLATSICLGIILVAAILIVTLGQGVSSSKKQVLLDEVKTAFQLDIQALKDGKYANLVYRDFESTIDSVEGLYRIDIKTDTSYENRTFLENFAIMNEVIDKFFQEDFDKSYIVADFYMADGETVYVNYDDIENVCVDEKYNRPIPEYLFGNNTSEGGYMVQIDEALLNVWFSKNGLNTIHPSTLEYEQVYPYLSGIRQSEDVEIHLSDGTIKLSDLEQKALKFLNSDFPMEVTQGISFVIGDARKVSIGDCEGIIFKVRRVYKGIPFEYGSNSSAGMYIDELKHDKGEIVYASSTGVDTMLSFGRVDGSVVEKETISKLLPLDTALQLLSEQIGENSIYDVYGIELVYRACEMSEEQQAEYDDMLKPAWKIISKNQNDDKYTLFYVDVVTGEITERFEYYYE